MTESVLERFARSVRRGPDRRAFSLATGETVSYQALDGASNRTATALIGHGVVPGDRVAILADMSAEYVEAFLAILKAGGCAVPLPTLIAPDALRLMLAEADPKVIFVSNRYRDIVRHGLGSERPTAGPLLVDFDAGDETASSMAGFRQTGQDHDPAVPTAPESLFNIIYSSGTTGLPKGIVHTHAFRAQYSDDVESLAIFEPGAIFVTGTPLYSNATIGPLFAMLGLGCETVGFGKFSVDAFFDLCAVRHPRHALLVPVQIARIADDPRSGSGALGSGMTFYSVGSKLPRRRKEQVLYEWGAKLVESYGMTEGGPATIFQADQATPADKLDSVGKPAHGSLIRIIDEQGIPLPVGELGEIVGRSSTQMTGYYRRPELTEAQLWRDEAGREFIRSGDIGRFDQDGYLYILDRKKEMIISGGFNIYASDLEAVLIRHPDVLEAAVIGVPNEEWGETPVAFAVPRPGRLLDAPELLTWANGQLGKVQRISALYLRAELPRGGIGKVLKVQLRSEVTGP